MAEHDNDASVPGGDRPFDLIACAACGQRWSSPTTGCPYCGSAEVAPVEDLPRRGSVYTWTTVYRPFGSGAEVPYTTACIELEGGGRVLGRIASGSVDGLAIGAAVRLCDESPPATFEVER